MTATDTLTCEGCSVETFDPVICDHRALCPDCVAESRCRECYIEARDECGAKW